MNITLENIDKVNAVITAVIEPADYTENYAKALKDAKKKIDMPGFRKGMVPMGLIKKQFGLSLLADEVNKCLQEGLYNYIRENKVDMLGEPLQTDDNAKVELVEGGTFTFKFDLAIAPEFEVKLSKKDTINYYNVEIPDEMVNAQIDSYRQRGAKHEVVESYEDNDMVKGVITELATENPVTAEGVVMLPKYFKNDDQKALFEGAKVNDVITFNPSVAYADSETELASLLKVAKEDALNHKGEFTFQITEISRYVPAELDQELFDSVFVAGEVKDEATFRSRIKDLIAEQFKKDSDYKFMLDARKYITDKVGKLEFPEEKLRKILLANMEGNEEKVAEQFDKSIEDLQWHLTREKLVKMYEVKVEDDDLKNMAKDVTKMQFAQYGMFNIPDAYLDNSVAEMLKNRETVENLINRCVEVKLGAVLKDKVKLAEKTVTTEEFNKLFE